MASARVTCLLVLLALAAPGAAAEARLDAQALDGAGVFQVGWRLVESTHAFEGRLDDGAQRSLRVIVTESNVTDVTLLLKWAESDDATGLSQPDLFEVSGEAPNGAAMAGSPARSRSGAIRLSSGIVNELPQALEVEASSLANARAKIADLERKDGLGAWKLLVRLVDAGTPGNAPVGDSGNTYELTVVVRHYEPVLTRIVSLDGQPTLSIAEAARRAPPLWVWSAMLLGGLSVALGVFIARDAVLRRRRR